MSQFHEAGQPVPGCYPSSASGAQRAIQAHRAILPIQPADVLTEGPVGPLLTILDRIDAILDRVPTTLTPGQRLVLTLGGLVVVGCLSMPKSLDLGPGVHRPWTHHRRRRYRARKKGHKK